MPTPTTVSIEEKGPSKSLSSLQTFVLGIRDGFPIALGYFAVSFALGIAAKNAGISAENAALMSLFNVTSAGQASAIELLRSGTTYLELAITQIVINLRYLLMSCSLSQKFSPRTPFFHRLLVGYGVTDEIFAISSAYPGKLNPLYSYGAIAIAVPGWTLGTFLGVLFGGILPDTVVNALSVALYSMFIAIIIPPTKKNRVLAVLVPLSMLCSWLFSCIPFLASISTGIRIILLTLLLAGLAAIFFPIKEESAS